jgi:ABC-2 type transport system ATP-binding protein
LSLARTLVHDPQVLILDEPASGLDPRARVEIRELLLELARMGKTIFFSTHILADVAEVCTRVGIIEAGKLVAAGTLAELHLQLASGRQVEIGVLERAEEAQRLLQSIPGVSSAEILENTSTNGQGPIAGWRIALEFSGDDSALSEILTTLVRQGIPVFHFTEDHHSLEEVFLRITKGLVT